MKKLNLIFLVFILMISCKSKPEFSETEKNQARLFIEAMNLDLESVDISNSRKAFTETNKDDIKRMLNLKKQALFIAEKIPDEVLKKMNKDLPEQYKKYKKGLALRIKNLELSDIKAELEGSKLIDEFIDWYEANMRNIKIPEN